MEVSSLPLSPANLGVALVCFVDPYDPEPFFFLTFPRPSRLTLFLMVCFSFCEIRPHFVTAGRGFYFPTSPFPPRAAPFFSFFPLRVLCLLPTAPAPAPVFFSFVARWPFEYLHRCSPFLLPFCVFACTPARFFVEFLGRRKSDTVLWGFSEPSSFFSPSLCLSFRDPAFPPLFFGDF